MSSDLSKKFIANTYQKLIQVDNAFGATGSDVAFSQSELVNTSKYSLLNGLGNKISAVAVESGATGSGIFLKNTTIDSVGAWGISTLQADPINGNTQSGLSFWRPSPSTNPGLHKLFLKNTGTTWIGYDGPSGSPGTGIVTDVATYSLYVKDGIQVGQNTTGNNGRINLIGDDPLENGAGMFINGEHPFKLVRYFYDEGDEFESFRTRYLKFPTSQSSQPGLNINNNPPSNEWISDSEWTALVVGFARSQQSGDTSITNAGCLAFTDGGYWKIGFSFANIAGSGPDQDWLIDVLFIKKGFFSNLRPSGRPSSAGSISDGSRGGSWT